MERISLVGIGPGSFDYLLPLALKRSESADILVGAPRHLEAFSFLRKPRREIEHSFTSALDFIEEKSVREHVCVLVSGDPCLYSYLSILKSRFQAERIEVIPGISSFQLLAAKSAVLWNEAVVVSVHGRSTESIIPAFEAYKRIVILTDPEHTPVEVAKLLSESGWGDSALILGKNLSYPDEKILTMSARQLAEKKEIEEGLWVMIAERTHERSTE
jgi:precorrin-6y C5,15-methyltransferase (decarboxylating) CbiE subunit